MTERVMPHSIDAERAVLGAVLAYDQAVLDVAGLVTPAEFFREAHRRIFAAVLALAETRATVDLVTAREWLHTRGELEDVGGAVYLAGLIDGVPRSTNVAAYAGIVREKAQLRALVHGAQKLLAEAYAADQDAATVRDTAERTLLKLAGGSAPTGFRSLREILPDVLAQLDTWSQSRTGVTGIATGLHALDQLTCGFHPGQLIVIAARPGMGKSSLALDIATHAARHGTVGLYSLEMEDTELVARALSSEAEVDGYRLKSGRLNPAEWRRVSGAMAQLGELALHIDDTPRLTPFEVRSRARRLKAQHGLSLLIVDYTQLMAGNDKERENRNLEIAGITGAMKALAKELQIPVVILSQLSRDLERRQDKRPMLSDLRDSGSLEQDADLVVFIFREEVYLTAAQRAMKPEVGGRAELIVAKQRNGPIGMVEVAWVDALTRFTNLEAAAPRAEYLPYAGDRA